MISRTIFTLFASICLLGCDDIPDVSGRYTGVANYQEGNPLQIVAQIPSLAETKNYFSAKFELVETTAKPAKTMVQLGFTKDGEKLFLDLPLIFKSRAWLQVNENQARGENEGKIIELGWANKLFSLVIIDVTSGKKEYLVNLHQSNDLPPKDTENASRYTLEELVGRAKFNAYPVALEAEKVFQAQNQVKVSIGNLLPHFNTRDFFPIVLGGGPLGLIEVVGDLAPFLFPSNWYQWEASKSYFKAQQKSFMALRANEMNLVHGLYYNLLRDQDVLTYAMDHQQRLEDLLKLVKLRETHGQLSAGSAERFSLSVLSNREDMKRVEILAAQELTSISYAVALNSSNGVRSIEPVPLPDLNQALPLDSREIVDQAKSLSLEDEIMNQLIQASKHEQVEGKFSFLDPSSNGSIGFGSAPSIEINKSKTKGLRIRKYDLLSLIEKRAVDIVNEWNRILEIYQTAQEGLNTSNRQLDLLFQRLRLGDDSLSDEAFIQDLSTVSQYVLRFNISKITAIYSALTLQAKIDRMLLRGFYNDLEAAMP